MLLTLLSMMDPYIPPALVSPTVTSVTAALANGGSCTGSSPSRHVGTAAVVRGTWAISGADWVNFTVKVYRNSSLVLTLTAAGTTTNDVNAPGVSGDANHVTTIGYNWRVDVVRNRDSVVVSTKTSSTYSDSYGDCNGPA